MRAFLLFVWVALLPRAAAAHSLVPGVGGLYAGALSLVAGPVDVLAWAALAVLAALHAPRPAGWVAELFAGGLLAGGLGAFGLQAGPPPVPGDAAVLLALGGLLALGRELPAALLYGLAVAAGAERGWHYGADMVGRTDVAALAAGLALAGYALVACGLAVALCFVAGPGEWRRIALRALGSWVSAVAILWGGVALRV